jgi:hypothetical protein
MHIRFAPKATVGDQTVIRRHMPNSVISRIGHDASLG